MSADDRAAVVDAPTYPPTGVPPHLNFTSEDFDPCRALRCTSIVLPYPRIQPLDNIATAYQMILVPQETRDKNAAARQAKKDAECKAKELVEKHPGYQLRIARSKAAKDFAAGLDVPTHLQPATTKPRPKRLMNVAEHMARSYNNGPMTMVKSLMQQKQRVKLMIRRSGRRTG